MRPDVLALDIRYAIRRLLQNPGFTLVACVSLAIGIGANTAAFSVLYAVLLRPLPVRDPSSLAVVGTRNTGFQYSTSYPVYTHLRDHATSVDGVIAFRAQPLNLTAGHTTERLTGMVVSGNYFSVLGVVMARGSAIEPADDEVPSSGGGRGLVAVLSHAYWTDRFARDPAVIGSSVRVNGHPFTVIGIAPADFHGTRTGSIPAVWVPMMFAPAIYDFPNWLSNPRNNWLRIIVRVKPHVTMAQAEAELTTVFQRLSRDTILPLATTESARQRAVNGVIALEPGHAGLLEMGNTVRPTLYALMALVSLVLLIACVNVANLMVARAERGHRSTAISIALGATRGRVWSQHLIESTVLGAAGVVLGLAVAVWMRGLLLQIIPPNQQLEVILDGRVLVACVATAFFIVVALAALTARQSVKLGVTRALKGEDLVARLWLRKALIVGQFALSIIVLVAAVLFARTLRNLRVVDPGFETARVLIASIATDGYTADQLNAFYANLLDDVSRLPGVVSAALANDAPLNVNTGWNIEVRPHTTAPPRQAGASVAFVSVGYFKTMGIPLRRGRDFDARDQGSSPRRIIVNENFVRSYISAADPVGAQVVGNGGMTFEIIGVVKDSASIGLRDLDQHMIYVMGGRGVLHVRTAVPPATLVSSIEGVMRRLDPNVPVYNIRTVEQQVEGSIVRERTFAALSSTFGVLALALSAVGLYGVMANAVSRRTKELGIRLALGARPKGIVDLVLREAGVLIALGVAAGLPCAWLVSRSMRNLLFGIEPSDWTSVAIAVGVLAVVTMCAALVPATRAARLDPLIALRSE